MCLTSLSGDWAVIPCHGPLVVMGQLGDDHDDCGSDADRDRATGRTISVMAGTLSPTSAIHETPGREGRTDSARNSAASRCPVTLPQPGSRDVKLRDEHRRDHGAHRQDLRWCNSRAQPKRDFAPRRGGPGSGPITRIRLLDEALGAAQHMPYSRRNNLPIREPATSRQRAPAHQLTRTGACPCLAQGQ